MNSPNDEQRKKKGTGQKREGLHMTHNLTWRTNLGSRFDALDTKMTGKKNSTKGRETYL